MANVVSTAGAERVWIRVAADGWPAALAEAPQRIEEGDVVWSWSNDCAPAKQVSAAAPDCVETEQIALSVRPAAGLRLPPELDIRWGTEAMLAALPDALLPVARTDAEGLAVLRVPKGSDVFARVAGPKLASGWARLRSPRIVLAASEAATATVDVTLAGDAAPFSRLELRTTDVPQPNGLAFRGVAERGAITIPPIPSGSFVKAIAWSESGAPSVISAAARRLPRSIALNRGNGIRGFVVDEEDKAVTGAGVSGLMILNGERIPIRKLTRSANDGAFAIGGFTPGDVEWIVAHDDFAGQARVVRLTADLDAGRVVLEKATTVRLQVTDAGGTPIARATVVTVAGIEASSDDSGTAVLRRVPARGFNLRATAHGFLPREARIEPGARQPPRVVLRRAASVRARVVRAADGSPAGPGTIVRDLDGATSVIDFGASGEIELDGLEAGRLSLDVRADGLAPFRVPERDLAAGEQVDLGTIRLDRGFSISGRAVAEESLEPVAGGTIRLLRPTANGPILGFLRREFVSATTGADGSFRIEGLLPGVYSLWTETPGRAPLVRTGIAVNDDVPNADIALGDLPIPAAHAVTITCEPAARCGSEATITIAGADWFPIAAPLAAGEASIQPVPAGSARLRLRDRSGVLYERDVSISATDEATAIAIRLHGVRVNGIVTRGGRPVDRGTVMIASSSPQDRVVQLAYRRGAGTIGNEMVGNLRRSVTADVDERGAFTLSDVAPGEYTVTWSSSFGASSLSRSVIIPDVEELPLRLDLPSATLTGTIRAADGSAPDRCAVTAETAAGTVQMLAAADGTFTIAGLAPGPALIRASLGRTSRAQKAVEIENGRDAHVDLTLEPVTEDALTVVISSEGMPVPNAFVFLRSNGGLRAATTGSNGRATFRVADAAAMFELAVLSGVDGWTFAGPRRASSTEIAVETPRARAQLSIRATKAAPIAIFTAGGFPVHEALALLGSRPVAYPDLPVILGRLPAGTYTVTAGLSSKSVTLSDDARVLTF